MVLPGSRLSQTTACFGYDACGYMPVERNDGVNHDLRTRALHVLAI